MKRNLVLDKVMVENILVSQERSLTDSKARTTKKKLIFFYEWLILMASSNLRGIELLLLHVSVEAPDKDLTNISLQVVKT